MEGWHGGRRRMTGSMWGAGVTRVDGRQRKAAGTAWEAIARGELRQIECSDSRGTQRPRSVHVVPSLPAQSTRPRSRLLATARMLRHGDVNSLPGDPRTSGGRIRPLQVEAVIRVERWRHWCPVQCCLGSRGVALSYNGSRCLWLCGCSKLQQKLVY